MIGGDVRLGRGFEVQGSRAGEETADYNGTAVADEIECCAVDFAGDDIGILNRRYDLERYEYTVSRCQVG